MAENTPTESSIFNVGDLAKPVDTLIQRTSDFIGATLAPRQLVRMAKAKVEADRIEKLGNAETEIRERALQRLLAEEVRNQENIENIVRLALPEVKEDAKPEEISDDWLALFFEKSKRFSDEEMQNLWAKILAGEANKAGSFSKRTIEIVSNLEKRDAELFTKLGGFGFNILGRISVLIYFNPASNYDYYSPELAIYKNNKIRSDKLFHLEAIGVIQVSQSESYTLGELPICLEVYYYKTRINVELNPNPNNYGEIDVGNVALTKSGEELAAICSSQEIDGYLEFVLEKWKALGYKVSLASQEKN